MEELEIGSDEKKRQLEALLQELERRKRDYGITSFKPFGKQEELVKDMVRNATLPFSDRERFRLYWGGNGSGKTAIAMYVTALLALGEDTKKY